MKPLHVAASIALLGVALACQSTRTETERTLSQEVLKDKIAGGWAGKMIGVTYGAPTEFVAQGKTFEDTIRWTPADIVGSMFQDDIYVQLTFLETMDRYGIDAPAKVFHEQFAKAGYPLWHANVQARKNYYDSIFPPASGHPDNNLHADDIDFQIEADYIGFMCPGQPETAREISDKIGHIMNYGDGIYGGIFVAALYAEAFLNDSIPAIVDKALRSIPAESDYARIVRDVQTLHAHYPADWRAAWQELENKWGAVHVCEAGSPFNIDAKLNGAYIAMGLLYGDGDVDRTLEISTRCGQDSDCNPSNAVAVLGIVKGLSGLPAPYREAVQAMGDSLFINTSYSFNKAVDRTLDYARNIAVQNSGTDTGDSLTIRLQEPRAGELEVSFPQLVLVQRDNGFSDAFATSGNWSKDNDMSSRYSDTPGDSIRYTFEGTGVSIIGNWVKNGGKADVFVDGAFNRTIDCYFDYADQEHRGINIFHILNLPEGKHDVTLVVREERNPSSAGSRIEVNGAIVYRTAPKTSDTARFSFQP